MMFSSAPKRLRYLFACFVLASYLGAYGGPVDVSRGQGLIARQASSTTTSVETSSTRTRSTTSAETTSSAVTSSTSVTTTSTSTTSSHRTSTTSTASSSTTSATSSSSQSSTSSSTSTSTTSSASATSTSSSSSILSKSSPYFGYAVGVLVVVSLFGLLLVVLIIRFIVQRFSKKPEPQPTASNSNAGQWRYSQDTELYSPGTVRNNSVNVAALGARHKDVGSEMGEREAFLSTESVALYPPAKEQDRYSDAYDDPTIRRHSRSLSNTSQSTATPYVNRRPNSMSFLHSPPATHPAFVVDHGSQSGHSHSDEHALRAVPEAPQETNEAGSGPRSMPSLLVARASHSDPYRQQTLASSAMVSRAASTASAYSQPSAIRSATPPFPVLLSAFAQPQPEVSPDVSAALSTMQAQNPSTDTIYTDESSNPSRTNEGRSGEQPTLRQTPGRMGWGGQAPTSIHSHADLFFDHSHSR